MFIVSRDPSTSVSDNGIFGTEAARSAAETKQTVLVDGLQVKYDCPSCGRSLTALIVHRELMAVVLAAKGVPEGLAFRSGGTRFVSHEAGGGYRRGYDSPAFDGTWDKEAAWQRDTLCYVESSSHFRTIVTCVACHAAHGLVITVSEAEEAIRRAVELGYYDVRNLAAQTAYLLVDGAFELVAYGVVLVRRLAKRIATRGESE